MGDAADSYVDGNTTDFLQKQGIDISKGCQENDAHHELQKTDGLSVIGPTGAQGNDLTVLLIGKQ